MQKRTDSQIDLLLNALGIGQKEFSQRVGITSNAVTNMKGKRLGTERIEKIVAAFPNVSREWLMTGEGDMFKNVSSAMYHAEFGTSSTDLLLSKTKDEPKLSYDTKVGVPYYAVEFEMGFDIMVNDQTTTPTYMINFPPYNKCTCWCNARGNSMSPTISSGDIIALKKIDDIRLVISDEIYAIVTSNGLRTIKRVIDNGQTLTLIPDNKEYHEQTIDKKDVEHIFQVMGSVKFF